MQASFQAFSSGMGRPSMGADPLIIIGYIGVLSGIYRDYGKMEATIYGFRVYGLGFRVIARHWSG